jgi:3-hydroxybutyryl-CoA dehydrogenase
MTARYPTTGIIGAGLMGARIATVLAEAGFPVTVYDPVQTVMPNGGWQLAPTIAEAASAADLVIEAAPENLDLKREIFAELDRVTRPDTVLASNTSAIPIARIAAGLAHPERVIGTHFWNPPHLVPLVEVVRSAASDPKYVDWTIDLLTRAGMKPVRVETDVPGFVGNRMQHALKREAIALVADGICTAETVDTVVRYGFGMRLPFVGPLEQSDLIGLDLTLAIHETLMPALSRINEPHPLLVDKVRAGETGAKAGRGFYDWAPGAAAARRAEINAALTQAQATSTTATSTTATSKTVDDSSTLIEDGQ